MKNSPLKPHQNTECLASRALLPYLIKRLRIKVENIAELGRLCGIERSFMVRLLSGERGVSIETLGKIYKGLREVGISDKDLSSALSEFLGRG